MAPTFGAIDYGSIFTFREKKINLKVRLQFSNAKGMKGTTVFKRMHFRGSFLMVS